MKYDKNQIFIHTTKEEAIKKIIGLIAPINKIIIVIIRATIKITCKKLKTANFIAVNFFSDQPHILKIIYINKNDISIVVISIIRNFFKTRFTNNKILKDIQAINKRFIKSKHTY